MKAKTRTYEKTHEFISYTLDLRELSYKLWMLLGAAESKCKHLAGIPLRPEKQQELNQISLKKGIRATTAIEGNTLTEDDVDKIYRGETVKIPLSRRYQAQEVSNVLEVYDGIIREIKAGKSCEATLETLKADNEKILEGVQIEDGVIPGEIRTYPVIVGNYRGAPAEDCEYLLERLFDWLSMDWGLMSDHPLVEGILKAVMSHLYIAWIHPFGDGNGRSARVLEFRMLMKAGVPSIAAHLLTSYYNDTRDMYYDMLKRSSRERNGEVEFINYAVQGFVDALDSQITSILDEQLKVTWKNYVHEVCFGVNPTSALCRRRDLLLGMSEFSGEMELKDLRHRLPNEVLKQYQGRSRMLMRDMNDLEKRGLIRRTPNGYEVAKEAVKAFLPLRNGE